MQIAASVRNSGRDQRKVRGGIAVGGKAFFLALLCLATAAAAAAQATFTTRVSFDGENGAAPWGSSSLVQGTDGDFYGTTAGGGGVSNAGTIFKVTSTGKLTTLHSFDGTDGADVYVGLTQGTDGSFYGATPHSGAHAGGTLFRLTPPRTFAVLYNFCSRPLCADGGGATTPVQGADGDFYGTTGGGGAYGGGTVFKITAAGHLTTLYSFCSQPECADGASPSELVQGADGNFYGTTSLYGGGRTVCNTQGMFVGCGTVFKITPRGELTTLHSFCAQSGCPDGAYTNGLLQATDGNFYGTTASGGSSGSGTIFKITSTGELTTIHSFCGEPGCGSSPIGLVQATDGNLYGTAFLGSSTLGGAGGVLFKVALEGTLTVLHSFDISGGYHPNAGLIQSTNGTFYGTTQYGGATYNGTVYSLAVGLRDFVETRPSAGKAGTNVIVLGNHLAGTTSVTFNGTAAAFTVISDSEIETTVPTGAHRGRVHVVTPSDTVTSNVDFRVTP